VIEDLFRHHDFLAAVAEEDVRYLKVKDRSYGASWKLSGGRSAWFMLRRKMDRMIQMLRQPDPPHGWSAEDYRSAIPLNGDPNQDVTIDASIARYLLDAHLAEDIFGKVEADPSGRDGCVLAEVRDLRRYLLLVEAEMVARGVVADPTPREERGPSPPNGQDRGVAGVANGASSGRLVPRSSDYLAQKDSTGMEHPFGFDAAQDVRS